MNRTKECSKRHKQKKGHRKLSADNLSSEIVLFVVSGRAPTTPFTPCTQHVLVPDVPCEPLTGSATQKAPGVSLMHLLCTQ